MSCKRFVTSVCLFVTMVLPVASQTDVGHPLDPLTAVEIEGAVSTLKAQKKATEDSRFYAVVLNEPPKSEVLGYKPGSAFRREAFVIVYDRTANRMSEVVVDLKERKIVSWKEVKGAQPMMVGEDFELAVKIANADAKWQEALKKRGINDPENVQIDPWAPGWFGFPDESNIRLARGIPFYRGTGNNAYGRPIDGLTAYIDLTNRKILKIIDTGVVPLPPDTAQLDPDSNKPLRTALKPLQIIQPEGASFEVRGQEVRWQDWRFRYAMHPREGLVLYTVGYEDKGRLRSILYRGSLSEMVVPYGDPSVGWFIRNAFDEGEYGVGINAAALDTNDVPPNATVLPAVIANERGEAQQRERIVALFERDGGVLWKHVDYVSGKNESRRARQLVLSMIATIGNYEYGFNWVFHQDGTLEMEALLTGVMSVKGVAALKTDDHKHDASYGHLVAPGIEAVHHQHFFSFRLDLDIDGANGNSVVEQNTSAAQAGPNNPHNNAFTMTESLLKRENEAKRGLNLASSRRWKVINPSVRNALGQPTGYLLMTGENSLSFSGVDSFVRKRAGFVDHHLWVTPHIPNELYAAGDYPNQSRGGDGLPMWTKANRPIENRDLVLWYSMGITHIPRPEDWPVMPVHKTGFKLSPNGFFGRNPAMDVPR